MVFNNAHKVAGVFNRVGAVHLHIDSGSLAGALVIAGSLGSSWPRAAAVAEVLSLVSGPQRDTLPGAYAEHHPAHDGDPSADSFISLALGSPFLLSEFEEVAQHESLAGLSVTIELEQVVDVVGWDGAVNTCSETLAQIRHDLTGFEQLNDVMAYEYHHAINLDKQEADLISAEQLMQACTSAGVALGSVYVFRGDDHVALRTNTFAPDRSVREGLPEENRTVRKLASQLTGKDVPVRTALECVLGIWKKV